MPKKLEDHLKHEVNTNPKYKHLSQERKNAIIYSTLEKTGWKPGKGEVFKEWPLTEEDDVLAKEAFKDLYKQVPW